MAYFSVNNLTLRTAEKVLIKDLCFQTNQPSLIAIIGHNGAGKTTFLKSLTGQAPYEGLLCFKDIFYSYPTHFSPTTYAYLEQKNEINFDISALEIVVMGCYGEKGFLESYSKQNYDWAKEMMDLVGISHLEKRSIINLSGGELRLVFLAQMLTQKADLLLLDEPTNSLDIRNKTNVMNVLKTLSTQQKTIVFTTHDLDYLYGINGYLINFSDENPILETINTETIGKHKELLMKQ